jgi:hypothetical protein
LANGNEVKIELLAFERASTKLMDLVFRCYRFPRM